jgi:hypothetical protein
MLPLGPKQMMAQGLFNKKVPAECAAEESGI